MWGPGRLVVGRSQEREPGLLVAGDDARLDPEALAQQVAELVAVLGVAHGARGHAGDRLGTVPVEQLAVAGHRVGHPPDRVAAQSAGGLEALAEAGDGGLALDHAQLAAVHVGHEQPRRVGAEIDDADALGCHATGPYTARAALRENPGARLEGGARGW